MLRSEQQDSRLGLLRSEQRESGSRLVGHAGRRAGIARFGHLDQIERSECYAAPGGGNALAIAGIKLPFRAILQPADSRYPQAHGGCPILAVRS